MNKCRSVPDGALFSVSSGEQTVREISSSTNEYIKKLKSLKEKKYRMRTGLYMVEGEKTVMEALRSPVLVESIITCAKTPGEAVQFAQEHGLDIVRVPREILVQIADTKTPPDILACIKYAAAEAEMTGRFFVLCDDVADPKNLGTIVRTADAAGADAVLISENSADPYGPKCQRACMGSMFHLPVEVGKTENFLSKFSEEGGTVIAGMLEGSSALEDTYSRVLVVVGNESRGVSKAVRERADIAYRIPIYGKCDSLNAAVAAGIMMYDIRRKLGE